jgi:hypothetical protein
MKLTGLRLLSLSAEPLVVDERSVVALRVLDEDLDKQERSTWDM